MEELDRIREEVRRYRPELLEDQEFKDWLAFLGAFPKEARPEKWLNMYNLFAQWVEQKLARYKEHPLYADIPRRMEWVNGIYLGQSFGRPVYAPPILLASNAFVIGQTNSGKTTTVLNMVSQLRDFGVTTWVMDFQQEYGPELKDYGFTVVPFDRLKLNPLNMFEGPGLIKNLTAFQRIFGHSQGLWDASQAFIGKHVMWLYDTFGSFEGKAYPNLHDLQKRIVAAGTRSQREREYQTATLNRLEDLLLLHGHVFDCQRGFSVETMVEENLIFDLRGLKPYSASLIAECLMAMLYEYRAAHGKQRQLHNILVCDEAKHLFHKRQQERLPDTQLYVDEVMAETRKYGIGLILADQQNTEITDSVAANSLLKVIMQLGSGRDINRIVQDAGLDEDQQREAYRLKQGEAILKVSGEQPFLIKFPRFS